MRISVLFAAGMLAGFPMAAAAQEALSPAPAGSCICVVPLQNGADNGVVTLEDIEGQVLLTGTHGYAPARSGAELVVGGRVLLLNEGRALLDAGATCRTQITAPSQVSIIAHEGTVCIAQSPLAAAVEPAPTTTGGERQITADEAGLIGLASFGAFAGLGAFLATRNGDGGRAATDIGEPPPMSP